MDAVRAVGDRRRRAAEQIAIVAARRPAAVVVEAMRGIGDWSRAKALNLPLFEPEPQSRRPAYQALHNNPRTRGGRS